MSEERVYILQDWVNHGPSIVAASADFNVAISDRWPHYVVDPISPEGGYGWQYGWRWLDEDSEDSRWTLPEAIHEKLPACPYAVRRGLMQRWPTVKEANAALSLAAKAWAETQVGANSRSAVDEDDS